MGDKDYVAVIHEFMEEFFMKDAVDNGKIRGASLRFANVYSKNERFAKHILPHIVNSLINDGKVVINGDFNYDQDNHLYVLMKK